LEADAGRIRRKLEYYLGPQRGEAADLFDDLLDTEKPANISMNQRWNVVIRLEHEPGKRASQQRGFFFVIEGDEIVDVKEMSGTNVPSMTYAFRGSRLVRSNGMTE